MGYADQKVHNGVMRDSAEDRISVENPMEFQSQTNHYDSKSRRGQRELLGIILHFESIG
jgi:hypothetical protein